MYYEANSKEIEQDRTWDCYLPSGCDWYDIWDNKKYDGGQTVTVDAPIDRIPIFVKSGSIIPMREGLSYAMEDNDEPIELHVYTGGDGEFIFYDDEGEGYAYEDGEYETILITWSDRDRKLTIGERGSGRNAFISADASDKGENYGRSFKGMKAARKLKIYVDGEFNQEIGYIDSRLELKL